MFPAKIPSQPTPQASRTNIYTRLLDDSLLNSSLPLPISSPISQNTPAATSTWASAAAPRPALHANILALLFDNLFLNSSSPPPISPPAPQDVPATPSAQAPAVTLHPAPHTCSVPRRVPQLFLSISPLRGDEDNDRVPGDTGNNDSGSDDSGNNAVKGKVIDLYTLTPSLLPSTVEGRTSTIVRAISIDSDMDDGYLGISSPDSLATGTPFMHWQWCTPPFFHLDLPGSDTLLCGTVTAPPTLGPSGVTHSAPLPTSSLSGIAHSAACQMSASALPTAVTANCQSWPADWPVIDVLACFVYCVKATESSNVKVEDAFKAFLPGVRFTPTFWKYHKHWDSADHDVKEEFVSYGRTPEGLWSEFAKHIPDPEVEQRNTARHEARSLKHARLQMD